MSSRIEAFAHRVQEDVFFLASALRDFADSEGLDDDALVTTLGCNADTLSLLRLCRRPRSEAPFFRQDVDRIALRFGIDPVLLAEIVRRSDSLRAFQGSVADHRGLLMAARDRQDETLGADKSREEAP